MRIDSIRRGVWLSLLAFAAPFACAQSDENTPLADQDASSSIPDSKDSGPSHDPGDDASVTDAAHSEDGTPGKDAASDDADTDDASDADADADVDDGVVLSPCSTGGFCVSPLPVQDKLLAVSGTAKNDVWAVGEKVILRWDGTAWTNAYQLTGSSSLFSVQAREADNVWAVGPHSIVRYAQRDGNPASFREEPFPDNLDELSDFLDTWQTWLEPTSAGLWLANANEVLRFHEATDGTLLVDKLKPAEPSATTFYRWFGVWGVSATDVYVSGDVSVKNGMGLYDTHSVIARYDGTTWSLTDYPNRINMRNFFNLWGATAGGKATKLFTQQDSDTSPKFSTIDVAADGTPSTVTDITKPGAGSCYQLTAGSAASSTDGWFALSCLTYRWNGTALSTVSTAIDGAALGLVSGVWSSGGDTWLVGQTDSNTGFAVRRRGL